MKFQRFVSRVLSENCYALSDGGACVIVDPGFYFQEEVDGLLAWLDGTVPNAILLTHGHFDHTMGIKRLQAIWPDVPVYMHPADEAMLEEDAKIVQRLDLPEADFSFRWTPAADGMLLQYGQLSFKAIATPGHSPGGIAFFCENPGEVNGQKNVPPLLFPGDIIFAGSRGRSDLFGGDDHALVSGIKSKLLTLPKETVVFPGHGPMTTIADESIWY